MKQLLTQEKRCRYNHPNVIKNIRAFWACPRNVPHKCFTNISKVSVFPSSSELPLLCVNVTFLWSYFQMSLSIYHAKNPLVLEIKFIIVYFQGMCKETSGMRLVNWLNYENQKTIDLALLKMQRYCFYLKRKRYNQGFSQ